MQKVIIVNVNATPHQEGNIKVPFSEHEIPELNKALSEGFRVVEFHQIAPAPNLYCSTLTFILEA